MYSSQVRGVLKNVILALSGGMAAHAGVSSYGMYNGVNGDGENEGVGGKCDRKYSYTQLKATESIDAARIASVENVAALMYVYALLSRRSYRPLLK